MENSFIPFQSNIFYVEPLVFRRWQRKHKSLEAVKARLLATKCVENVTIKPDTSGNKLLVIEVKHPYIDGSLRPSKKHGVLWKAAMVTSSYSGSLWRFESSLKNDLIFFSRYIAANQRLPRMEELLAYQFDKMACKIKLVNSAIESDWVWGIYTKMATSQFHNQLKFGIKFNYLVENTTLNLFNASVFQNEERESDFYIKIKREFGSLRREPIGRGGLSQFSYKMKLGDRPFVSNIFKLACITKNFYYGDLFGDHVGLEVYTKTVFANYKIYEYMGERGFLGDLSAGQVQRSPALSHLASFKLNFHAPQTVHHNWFFPFFSASFFARNFQFLCWEFSLGLEKNICKDLNVEVLINLLKGGFQVRFVSDKN